MRYSIKAMCLLLLVGCCKQPVVMPCQPPPPVSQPILRTASLTAASPAAQVMEAYVLDLAEWVGYAKKLETYLDAYRTTPATPPPPK